MKKAYAIARRIAMAGHDKIVTEPTTGAHMYQVGSAHDAREKERKDQVTKLEDQILRVEKTFGTRDYFLRIFTLLIVKEISRVAGNSETPVFDDIPETTVSQVCDFFSRYIRPVVTEFQKSDDEAALIYVQLLESIRAALADVIRNKVVQQEKDNPQQMLSAESRMSRVQY